MKRLSVLFAAIFLIALMVGLSPEVNSGGTCDIFLFCNGLEDPACNVWYCCVNPHPLCQEQGYPVRRVGRAYLSETSQCDKDCWTYKDCAAFCDPL